MGQDRGIVMDAGQIQALVLALLLFVIPSAVLADSGARLLRLEDGELLKSPGTPAIAPDEERLAVAVNDGIEIVDLRSGAVVPLDFAGTAWDPAWSSDGGTLWFLSDRSGTSQLWAVDGKSLADPRQLTTFDAGISELRMSPDGTRLLLSSSMNDLDTDDNAESQPFVITRLEFKEDAGHGYITDADIDQLYVLDIGSGKFLKLTEADRSAIEPAWSPDGKSIAFVRDGQEIAGRTYALDIWVVDAAASGPARRTPIPKCR